MNELTVTAARAARAVYAASRNGTVRRRSRADLTRADLSSAVLLEAELQWVNLRGADLAGADLCGALLPVVNLQGAILAGARYDTATRWPPGFDAVRRGARPVK